MILVTGSSGLIGRYFCAQLAGKGIPFRGFDVRNNSAEDVRDPDALKTALEGVSGVVHLAALSRVVWAEQHPALCHAVNVEALRNLVRFSAEGSRPWLIFASSREVYGNASKLPVHEDAPLRPMNVYARSKVEGEAISQAARGVGLTTNTCRFSNVFGCVEDYPDRVAMAFAGIAARGGTMSVQGSAHLFDFTAVEDAVDGLLRLVEATMLQEKFPPVHFVSGQGTTLRELAQISASFANIDVGIEEALPRSFDVSAFVGDPSRAVELLGWRARENLNDRMRKLISDLAAVSSPSTSTNRVIVRDWPDGYFVLAC